MLAPTTLTVYLCPDASLTSVTRLMPFLPLMVRDLTALPPWLRVTFTLPARLSVKLATPLRDSDRAATRGLAAFVAQGTVNGMVCDEVSSFWLVYWAPIAYCPHLVGFFSSARSPPLR